MEPLDLLHMAVRHEISKRLGKLQWPITLMNSHLETYVLHGVMTVKHIGASRFEIRSKDKPFIEVKFNFAPNATFAEHNNIDHIRVEPKFMATYIGLVRMSMAVISEYALKGFEDEVINRKP